MIEESIRFRSGELMLEGRFAYTDDAADIPAAVLICPPHPFLGGDMENNVVSALATTLAHAGLPVLRFNYRGIGASETRRDLIADQAQFWASSTCPDYEAEIHEDCHAAFHELRRLLPAVRDVHVIGYSFGCLPALLIALSEAVGKLGIISPPLVKWPLNASALGRQQPFALFYAPGDFACPEENIRQVYDAIRGPKQLHAFPQADHFYVGHEQDLAEAAARFLAAA